jgi:hypothetical protein
MSLYKNRIFFLKKIHTSLIQTRDIQLVLPQVIREQVVVPRRLVLPLKSYPSSWFFDTKTMSRVPSTCCPPKTGSNPCWAGIENRPKYHHHLGINQPLNTIQISQFSDWYPDPWIYITCVWINHELLLPFSYLSKHWYPRWRKRVK